MWSHNGPGVDVSDQQEQLAQVLSEFARTMLTDFSIETILDELVSRIVELLPITAAGVTLITPPLVPHYVAASNPLAMRFEELQTEIGEGPCLRAHETGERVLESDLRSCSRFPRFATPAVTAGLAAVFAFPLKHGPQPLGALGLYRDTPGPLDPPSLRTAQTLADVAAAYLLNAQARIELQRTSDLAHRSAQHDPLTDLPNRTLLLERLAEAFAKTARTQSISALLFVDIDGFKQVNDQHGHATGDELLVALAARLTAILRPSDTLSRLHGDEFVVLCEDLHHRGHAQLIARRIDQALQEPIALTTATVTVTASVGIAYADRDLHTPEQVLHNADTAMYEAKRTGHGRRHTWQSGDPVV